MDWWKFGGGGGSVDTTLHTFLSMPACTACTHMVYSKELERDVTTTTMAKALVRLKTFTKTQNKREYLPLFGFSVTMPQLRKVPYVTKEQIYVYAISR